MKIVYLLTTADASAGTENAIITQANAMVEHARVEILSVHRTTGRPHFRVGKGIRVRYIADAPTEKTPSRVIPASWDNQFDASTDASVERELRGLNADFLVTTTPALAYLASRYAPPRVRIVHQEHRASAARHGGFEPLRLAAPRLAAIVALTEPNADWLRRELAGSGTPILVVPNGMDVAGAPVSNGSQRLIISAGRFVPAKQFDHLIHAFARADEEVPGWQLRIYGDGPSRPTLQTVIRRRGLETKVSLPGVVPDIPTQMAKASIFALASRSEALPLVLLEAQSAGVPVVSYDTKTGPRDILEVTGGGLVVPQDSRWGLAAGLARLMKDDDLRGRLSASARQGAWEFDLTAVTARWCEVFGGLKDGRYQATLAAEPESVGASEQINAHGTPVEEQVLPELTRRGIRWRRVPTRGQAWKVVTAHAAMAEVLDAFGTVGDGATWILPRVSGQGLSDPWPMAERAPLLADAADEFILQSADGEQLGTIQLWKQGADGDFHRPVKDTGPASIDPEHWAAWEAAGSATVSQSPYWDTVTFPVDVVYTWVDGSDPAWRAKREPFLADVADRDSDSARDARYRSRDELFYSISSVRRYMPWVRRIIVVTDSQTPERVVEAFPDVEIVDHRDIFPDPSVLPVFNSHAIEACLHRIPGLAEHYLYFNDDFLIARPVHVDQFFLSNGIAKFFPHGVEINYGGQEEKPHLQAGANNRDLLLRDFGVEITRSLMHVPYAQRKSAVFELEERYTDEFARTRSSRFRSPSDISVPSSLAPYYGYLTGRHIPAGIGYRYASLRADALASRLQSVLNDPKVSVVAIAEPMNDDRRHRDEEKILHEFLEELVGRGNPLPAVPLATALVEAVPVTAAVGEESTAPGSAAESPER